MNLLALFSIFSYVIIGLDARVTFPFSEVLQAADLVNKAASFNCDNGCKVYVDRRDASLTITQNGQFIANFNTIVGDTAFTPVGLELKAGKNYKIESANEVTGDFVFYAVSVQAPNYGVSVLVPQETIGISLNGVGRYATILSSFNAIRWFGFKGTYPAGYPRIYSTGHDSVLDEGCTPVYQGRSQYNAEQSQPVIFSPIQTVDFGYVAATIGDHVVNANQRDGKAAPLHNNVSSTVYMSPGFVGCTSVAKQVYYSSVKSVKDSFKLDADSLDYLVTYNAVSSDEPVHIRVNDDVVDIMYFGASSFTKHYPKGTMDFEVSWTRATEGSSWALQLDFGTVPDPVPKSTTQKSATSQTGTVSNGVSTTTKGGRNLFSLGSLIAVLVMVLTR